MVLLLSTALKIHFMKFTGALNKMITMHENPVRYALSIGDDILQVNGLINKQLEFYFSHKHFCYCDKIVDKVYRNNFCYDCYFNNPAAGDAIFRPELSKAHLGIADRDLEFEQRYQLQPHVVYLANSGGLKVGVTRQAQKATRWMDQGANQTIVLAETSNRHEAGLIEIALKEHVADKTNWRNMLTNNFDAVDLLAEKKRLANLLSDDLQQFISANDEIFNFEYPVLEYPVKVSSLNFNKADNFAGTLTGIKGQYLLFENGAVFNVRSHEGYLVDLVVR